jgi:hypothetical protein
MKYLIALLFVTSAFATETMILTKDKRFGIVVGFSDSSFNYTSEDQIKPEKFCFIGDIDKVCDLVAEAVYNRNAQYAGGAHDRIAELKCLKYAHTDVERYPKEGLLEVTYRLQDDYGSDFSAYRLIRRCVKSSIQ